MSKVGSKALLKRMNRMRVLNTVRERQHIGRAEVADITGISRASVTYLVGELVKDGWLIEYDKGETTQAGGRPPILLQFNPDAIYAVVVMIGSEQTTVAVGDGNAHMRYHETQPSVLGQSADEAVELVVEMIERALMRSGVDRQRVGGVAIGVPGLVDAHNSIVHYSARLPVMREIDLGSIIASRVGLPVMVENETRLIGWGELRFGSGRGYSPLVCVSVTLGIGSCIILEDRMLSGSSYSAGQFGHMTIDEHGPLCECGNRGCWEALASSAAVLQRARQLDAAWAAEPTIPDILEAVGKGDKAASKLMHETAVHLGIGLANIINIVNPSIIVLHGKMFEAGDQFLQTIRQTVASRALKLPALNTRLLVSELGEQAGVAGGVTLVMRSVLESPLEQRANPFYV
ncbi:ROK family transcriptional regulator [Devosia nitrariae]|uniref:Transcriptional regulator n=1 Tax=Devosia nitrariae TaxID=2071872 RepID=A0ABQ5WDC1_9HYPH|nr:ROK family transcriptional regulator [Devosia nitrariae]GLQ57957.1 transcriptional regulator [Devosia nitrariae]